MYGRVDQRVADQKRRSSRRRLGALEAIQRHLVFAVHGFFRPVAPNVDRVERAQRRHARGRVSVCSFSASSSAFCGSIRIGPMTSSALGLGRPGVAAVGLRRRPACPRRPACRPISRLSALSSARSAATSAARSALSRFAIRLDRAAHFLRRFLDAREFAARRRTELARLLLDFGLHQRAHAHLRIHHRAVNLAELVRQREFHDTSSAASTPGRTAALIRIRAGGRGSLAGVPASLLWKRSKPFWLDLRISPCRSGRIPDIRSTRARSCCRSALRCSRAGRTTRHAERREYFGTQSGRRRSWRSRPSSALETLGALTWRCRAGMPP